MTTAVHEASIPATVRDLIALTKPQITLMVLITAAGGVWLAPGVIDLRVMLVMLGTTGMIVAAANALNCYLERDVDRLMERTAMRPLPDGRMQPGLALVFGVALAIVAVPLLTFAVNPLTGLLGLIALVSYVAVYTPMKQITPAALLVGAVPGALPPLMGWTAVTNSLDAPGLVLFGVLFFWQLPHFIAISIFRQSEYERAGLKVMPSVRGLFASKVSAVVYTVALIAVSVLLVPLGAAGYLYLATALIGGAVFLWTAVQGFRPGARDAWAKKLFFVSLIYLTTLFLALMLDAS